MTASQQKDTRETPAGTRRRLTAGVGTLLIVTGVLVLGVYLVASGTPLGNELVSRLPSLASATRTEEPPPTAAPSLRPEREPDRASTASSQTAPGEAAPEPRPTVSEAPAATQAPVQQRPASPTPVRATPAWAIVIPRIGVASEIVESRLERGEWTVPKFVVGHLQGTPNPGEIGNAAFAGHLLSLSSGNVFARLDELEVGDEMLFHGDDVDRVFKVIGTRLVMNTDLSVLNATPGKSLVTLITCAGTWLPLEQDYSHRRVVTAELLY